MTLPFNKITKQGFNQGDLVELLDRMTGELWIPISAFSNVGAATLVATGGTTTVGMTFETGNDEHVSINLKVPKDLDVTKAFTFKVWWSSAGTSDTETFLAVMSLKASADGEDVGDTHTLKLSTADVNSATADALRITPVITVAANFLASTDELLSISLFRDVTGDDAGEDVTVYGVQMEYTTIPEIDKDA